MGALQPAHLILVLVLVLIVFGPGKLPSLGKSLGDGIREFRKSTEGDAAHEATTTTTTVTAAPRTCRQCAAELSGEQKFCGVCGTSQVTSVVG